MGSGSARISNGFLEEATVEVVVSCEYLQLTKKLTKSTNSADINVDLKAGVSGAIGAKIAASSSN
jgi:hypothetical protein